MKLTILIGVTLLLLSCSQQQDETISFAGSDQNVGPLLGLSIFHLPSDWITQDNESIKLKDLRGNVLVMVMIYTSCQASCPRLVADMRSIESKIPGKFKEKVKLLLVSIDPKNDTPESLKKFAIDNKMAGDQWMFLNGTEEDVREFAMVLGFKYKKISPIDFSHSNIISVFNHEGVLTYQKNGLGVDNKEIVSEIIKSADAIN